MTLKNKSWKTTTVAITAIVVAIGTMIVEPLLDSDPATVPKWQECVVAIIAGSTGFWTRDDDKSSKQVGVE